MGPGMGGPGMGGPGMGGGMMGMGGRGGSSGGGKGLADLTGTYGTAVVEQLRQYVANGDFGSALKRLDGYVQKGSIGAGQGAMAGGMGMGGGMAGAMGPPGGPGGKAGMGGLGMGAGPGGPPGGGPAGGGPAGPGGEPGGEDGGGPGGPGGGGPGMGMGFPGMGARPGAAGGGFPGAMGGRGGAGGGSSDPSQFAAGLTYLGVASDAELKRKAREQGADVLLVFHVSAKHNSRTNLVTTTTRFDVIDMVKGTVLFKGPSLTNIKVQQAQTAGKADLVEKAIETFAQRLEDPRDGLVVTDLPAGMKPQHAAARVEYLAGQQYSNPLPFLAEITFYFSRGLIDDEIRTRAYQQILDQRAGEKLSLGKDTERLEILSRWLPKE